MKGSYFVYDIPTFSMSLLVVRGQDDVVRVFHNICRHRGDRLVHPGQGRDQGCRKAFTCGFHAWTFSNTGKLLKVKDGKTGDYPESFNTEGSHDLTRVAHRMGTPCGT